MTRRQLLMPQLGNEHIRLAALNLIHARRCLRAFHSARSVRSVDEARIVEFRVNRGRIRAF
jgi:hypothetical protein